MALLIQRQVIIKAVCFLLLTLVFFCHWNAEAADVTGRDSIRPEPIGGGAYGKLAKAIVEDGSAIAINVKAETVVYSTRYRVEGTGQGVFVWFFEIGQKKPLDRIAVYEPDDEDWGQKIPKAVDTLTSRLEKGEFHGVYGTKIVKDLDRTEIPGGVFQWGKNRATFSVGNRTGSTEVHLRKPYIARPEWLYAEPDLPVAAVSLEHDPGDAYGEGYNFFTTVEFVRLKQKRTDSAK